MSDYYIYSTLAADVSYTDHRVIESTDKICRTAPEQSVVIKGGAGVAKDWDRRSTAENACFYTKDSVVTGISAEQYQILKSNPVFQIHLENAHVSVQKKKIKAEKVRADLAEREPSSPTTPGSLKLEAQIKESAA